MPLMKSIKNSNQFSNMFTAGLRVREPGIREQFLLAGGGVGGYAGVESQFDVGQRSVGVAAQQVLAGPLKQQVDVVQAKPAVAGDFQFVGRWPHRSVLSFRLLDQ